MAVTLSARAGSQHVSRYVYWLPEKTGVVNTEGFTLRVQVRDARPPARVLISANEWVMTVDPDEEPPDGVTDPAFLHLVDPDAVVDTGELDLAFTSAPPGTPLLRIHPGIWVLRLGRTVTRTLPPTSRFELELVNDADPEDVTLLVSGVIRITPEVVANVVSDS
jgi:hypothetical protein